MTEKEHKAFEKWWKEFCQRLGLMERYMGREIAYEAWLARSKR